MKDLEIDRMSGTVTGIDESGRRFTCTIYQNLQTGGPFQTNAGKIV